MYENVFVEAHRIKREAAITVTAIMVAALFMSAIWAIAAHNRDITQWAQETAQVTSEPNPEGSGSIWVAEVTYEGESTRMAVDPQTHVGDNVPVYVDSEGTPYRATFAGDTPITDRPAHMATTLLATLVVMGITVLVALIAGVFSEQVEVLEAARARKRMQRHRPKVRR